MNTRTVRKTTGRKAQDTDAYRYWQARTSGDPDAIFPIGIEPNRVDVLQGIAAVSFEEAWQRRVLTSLDDGPAYSSREKT